MSIHADDAPAAEVDVERLVSQVRAGLDADGCDEIDVGRADWLAAALHRGQTDQLGVEYITHPRAVAVRAAELVDALPATQRTERVRALVQVAALLHDSVEDTPITAVELARARVPEPALRAVEAVTKTRDEPYAAAVRRATADPLGRVVKAADLDHNRDPRRVAQLRRLRGDAAADRLEARYAPARRLLAEVLARHGLDAVSGAEVARLADEVGVAALSPRP